jgi:hypothetical protein
VVENITEPTLHSSRKIAQGDCASTFPRTTTARTLVVHASSSVAVATGGSLSYARLGIHQNNPRNALQIFTCQTSNGFADFDIDAGAHLYDGRMMADRPNAEPPPHTVGIPSLMRRRSPSISGVIAMRVLCVLGVLIAGLCGTFRGQAQTTPNVLIAGQVESALAYGEPGWCAVTQGTSTMQRNQAAPIAVVSFPELIYFDGTTYYLLNGQARLTFKSPTAGAILFKNTSFAKSIKQYVVRFSIVFPHNCTLPISADFEAP